jgi:hypothetical protein
MIELGDKYKIDSDSHQLILRSKRVGLDKDGNQKDHWHETYHANIKQVARAISDRELKEFLEHGIIAEYVKGIDRLCLAVEQVSK